MPWVQRVGTGKRADPIPGRDSGWPAATPFQQQPGNLPMPRRRSRPANLVGGTGQTAWFHAVAANDQADATRCLDVGRLPVIVANSVMIRVCGTHRHVLDHVNFRSRTWMGPASRRRDAEGFLGCRSRRTQSRCTQGMQQPSWASRPRRRATWPHSLQPITDQSIRTMGAYKGLVGEQRRDERDVGRDLTAEARVGTR